MKKLHVAFLLAAIAPACSKDGADDAKPGANSVDSSVESGVNVVVVDAGPTAPMVTLDVSNPSPHAWAVSGDLLPAISADGATVAILSLKEDGTRMYANAALEVHNVADDKVLTSIPILVADDVVAAEGMPDAFHTTLPAYKTKAQGKADEANALLGKNKWIALSDRNGNPPQPDGGAPPIKVSSDQVLLNQNGKALTLIVTSGTQVLLNQDVSTMLIAARKPPKPQKGNPLCRFTPYVAEAAVNSKVVVARIGQSVVGNVYGCFEPSQWHVYPLGDAMAAPAPSGAPSAAPSK
jgi:hypothetical protein